MFCTNCGLELASDVRFCSQCGQGTRMAAAAENASNGYYAPRRLYRLMYDKQIGGVCSGLAKYFDMDVTLVRVMMLAAAVVSGGLGAVAYLGAMIVMPKDYGAMRAAPVGPVAPTV